MPSWFHGSREMALGRAWNAPALEFSSYPNFPDWASISGKRSLAGSAGSLTADVFINVKVCRLCVPIRMVTIIPLRLILSCAVPQQLGSTGRLRIDTMEVWNAGQASDQYPASAGPVRIRSRLAAGSDRLPINRWWPNAPQPLVLARRRSVPPARARVQVGQGGCGTKGVPGRSSHVSRPSAGPGRPRANTARTGRSSAASTRGRQPLYAAFLVKRNLI